MRVIEQENVNQITDNGNGSYTIRNAEECVRSLKVGDRFSCTTMDGTIIVFRVSAISVSGTTVTLTEDKTATLEDIFEYVKIEDVSDGTGSTVDTTEMDVGVSYVGEEITVLNTYESGGELLFGNNADKTLDAPILNTQVAISKEEQTVTFNSAPARDIDQTLGSKFKFKIENEKASGEITFGVSVNFKFYKSGSWTYQSFKIDFSTKATLEILSIAEFEKEIKLGEPQVPVGASGLKASFPISFVFKANARIAITQEMKMTLGFAIDSDYGFLNLSSLPTLEGMKLDISGKVYIGFKIEAKISTFFNLAATSISGEVGFEASGKMKGWPFELGSTSKKHECDACIEGSIKAQCGFKVKLSALSDEISQSWTIVEFEWKLADFYYSLTNQTYGWGTCPFITYRVKIHVVDPNDSPVDWSQVCIEGYPAESYPTTDEDGMAEVFLPSGQYKIYTYSGNGSNLYGETTITVKDFSKDVILRVDDNLLAFGKWGNLDWLLDRTGLLTISGNGSMNSFYFFDYSTVTWIDYTDYIKSIEVKTGVTSISNSAFWGCEKLERVSLPGSVTSIDDNAFFGCSKLKIITIPEGVTSIGSCAFQMCSSLESITIPSSLTWVGARAFDSCSSMKCVFIDDMTAWCGIDFGGSYISWIDDSNPISIDGVDLYLNGVVVRDLVIPNGVTKIGNMAFGNYRNLTSVTIPSSVTSIGAYSFANCDIPTSIQFPDNLSSIGAGAFEGWSNLSSVDIPPSVWYIAEGAFAGCGLTNVTIPNSITSIYNSTFMGCENLENVSIPESVTYIGDDAFFGCTKLKNIIIPEGVTSIGSCAFQMCSGLESVTIPSSLTWVGARAFDSCSSMKCVFIDDMAAWCGIDFGGSYISWIDDSNPISIDGVDLYLNGVVVRDLMIPNGVTKIGNMAFGNYRNLTSVTIPSSVTSIGAYSFANCDIPTSIQFPDNLSSIGAGAFEGWSNLSSVDIPPSVWYIAEGAFAGCGLTNVTIPNSITSIYNSTFMGCENLENVSILGSVTYIGDDAFFGCGKLKSISIPVSVNTIGRYAFFNCDLLADIYYTGTIEQWLLIDVYDGNEPLNNAMVHCIESNSSITFYLSSMKATDKEKLSISPLSKNNDRVHRTLGPINYQEVVLLASFFGDTLMEDNQQRAIFTGLVPGSSYLLLIVEDGKSDKLLSSGNLLYISQLTADNNGQISLLYVPRFDSSQNTALAFGQSTNNLKDAMVSLEQRSDGILQVDVFYGALKLINDIDYTYEVETGNQTVTVTIKGRGDYAGTIKVEADKLPHTPGVPVLEDDLTATDKSVVTVHCSKCGAEISRREFNAVPDFILPAALTTVGNEAFTGGSFIYVKLPENAVSIGWHAFADCPNLAYIYIPALTTQIDEQAFGTIQNLTILGKTGTTAETYAQDHNYAFIAVP